MKPVPRIVAVCQGGELDGLRFSVALADDGSLPLLRMHGGSSELVYEPRLQLALDAEHALHLDAQRRVRRGEERALDDLHPVFMGFELFDPETDPVEGHLFLGAYIYEERAE